jgi:hypothetical protein
MGPNFKAYIMKLSTLYLFGPWGDFLSLGCYLVKRNLSNYWFLLLLIENFCLRFLAFALSSSWVWSLFCCIVKNELDFIVVVNLRKFLWWPLGSSYLILDGDWWIGKVELKWLLPLTAIYVYMLPIRGTGDVPAPQISGSISGISRSSGTHMPVLRRPGTFSSPQLAPDIQLWPSAWAWKLYPATCAGFLAPPLSTGPGSPV